MSEARRLRVLEAENARLKKLLAGVAPIKPAAGHTGRRAIRAHEGVVIAPASDQRWASDGFERECLKFRVWPVG